VAGWERVAKAGDIPAYQDSAEVAALAECSGACRAMVYPLMVFLGRVCLAAGVRAEPVARPGVYWAVAQSGAGLASLALILGYQRNTRADAQTR
jgi:hypothetical protein